MPRLKKYKPWKQDRGLLFALRNRKSNKSFTDEENQEYKEMRKEVNAYKKEHRQEMKDNARLAIEAGRERENNPSLRGLRNRSQRIEDDNRYIYEDQLRRARQKQQEEQEAMEAKREERAQWEKEMFGAGGVKVKLTKKYESGGVNGDPKKDGDPKKEGDEGYVSPMQLLQLQADEEGREVRGTSATSGGLEGGRYVTAVESTTAPTKALPHLFNTPSEPEDDEETREPFTIDRLPGLPPHLLPRIKGGEIQPGEFQDPPPEISMENPLGMSAVIDPSSLDQGIYKNYTKTMGVKMINPETGKEEFYYAPTARGTKSRGGSDDFKTFDDLPEEQRILAQGIFDDSETEFLKDKDYIQSRGGQYIKREFRSGGRFKLTKRR